MLASGSTYRGAVSNILKSNLDPDLVLCSDSNGKVNISTISITSLENTVSNVITTKDGTGVDLFCEPYVLSRLIGANSITIDRIINVGQPTHDQIKIGFDESLITTMTNFYNKTEANLLFDLKEDTITGGATTITSDDLALNKAVISNGVGKIAVSTITSTEIGYLTGLTENISTSLNAKQNTLSNNTSGIGEEILFLGALRKLNATSPLSVQIDGDFNINFSINLSNYYTSTQVDTELALKQNSLSVNGGTGIPVISGVNLVRLTPSGVITLNTDVNDNIVISSDMTDFYTSSQTDTLLNTKQATLSNRTGTGQIILDSNELKRIKGDTNILVSTDTGGDNNIEISLLLTNLYTKTETDNLLNAKQNTLSNNSSGVGEVLLSGSTLKKINSSDLTISTDGNSNINIVGGSLKTDIDNIKNVVVYTPTYCYLDVPPDSNTLSVRSNDHLNTLIGWTDTETIFYEPIVFNADATFSGAGAPYKKTETYSQTEIDTSLNLKNDVITNNALGTGSELLNSNTLKKLRPTTGSKISVGVDTDSNIEIGCDLTDYYTSTQVDNIITTRNNTFNITGQASYVYMGTSGFGIRNSTDTSTVFA